MDDSAFSQELCFQVFFLFEAPPLFVRIYEQADFSFYSRGGSRGGTREARPPLFFDQIEARRAENFFFFEATPSLSQGLHDRPVPPPPVPRYLKFWIRHCNAVKIRVALSLC